MDNKTDNSNADYIMVEDSSNWSRSRFYDDNTDNIIYHYYVHGKSFVPRIIPDMLYKPKCVIEEQHEVIWLDMKWKTNMVTRDQWNKFLTTLRMLSVALEASIQQPLMKFRDYTFFPSDNNSFMTYAITKHSNDLISVSRTYTQYKFEAEHVIPYSPNIEEIVRRFVSEVTTTMDNWGI